MSLLDRLGADFPKSEVKQRDAGRGLKLDYIDIVSTINRFCDTLGADWDWQVTDSDLTVVELDGPKFLARVQGQIRVWLPELDHTCITRGGVGADLDARDPDKAIKTADAEALKKAGHKFRIALYLWDESKRDEVAAYRSIEKAPLAAVKKAVAAKAGTSDPAALYDLLKANDREQLQDRVFLLNYLAA